MPDEPTSRRPHRRALGAARRASGELGAAALARLPHLLSIARMALGPVFVLALDDAAAVPVAIALAAAATDFADGRVARAVGATSAGGAALDVAADAVFLLFALSGLAAIGRMSAALPAAAAVSLFAFARARRAGDAGSARAPADRLGHAAGVLNFGAVLLGAGAPLLGGLAHWLPPASVALALLNLAPLPWRWWRRRGSR